MLLKHPNSCQYPLLNYLTSIVDESLSPQGAGALPSRMNEPDTEIAEEAKEDEKETLSDKKSEPTPIPNKLNLVSVIIGIPIFLRSFTIIHIFIHIM